MNTQSQTINSRFLIMHLVLMDIIIRQAKENDLSQIHEMDKDVVVFVAALDPSKNLEEVNRKHNEVFERWLNLEQQMIYLAFKKTDLSMPIGFIWLVSNNEQFTGIIYCFVMDLGIKDGYRRMGVGQALMKKALEYARSRGYDRIKLMVNSRNKNAIRFYRNMGFEVEDLYMKKTLK